jgi:hypothetical protein
MSSAEPVRAVLERLDALAAYLAQQTARAHTDEAAAADDLSRLLHAIDTAQDTAGEDINRTQWLDKVRASEAVCVCVCARGACTHAGRGLQGTQAGSLTSRNRVTASMLSPISVAAIVAERNTLKQQLLELQADMLRQARLRAPELAQAAAMAAREAHMAAAAFLNGCKTCAANALDHVEAAAAQHALALQQALVDLAAARRHV